MTRFWFSTTMIYINVLNRGPEAVGLAHNEQALAERVYGLGNPSKAAELGNTKPGDGFLYRGNGVLQTTGRGAHRRTGEACGMISRVIPN